MTIFEDGTDIGNSRSHRNPLTSLGLFDLGVPREVSEGRREVIELDVGE
jgi:hypothetical protein